MHTIPHSAPADKPHYVYSLAYPDGKVFYIGKGTGLRIDDHEREARRTKRSSHKLNTIRKIWASGGQVLKEKLAFFATHEEACLYEIALIFFMNDLTNVTDGGDGIFGYVHTETELQKIRDARQRQVITEEHKRNLGKSHKTSERAQKARQNLVLNQTGKPKSPATVKKLSEIGKARTDLHKMHEANRGRVQTEKERQMRSLALKGRPKPPRTEEHRRKLGEAARLRAQKHGEGGKFIRDSH